MTNNESMLRMMIAGTKRVRVARAMMVMATRVAGNKEGEGIKEADGIGNKGGM
jgi:hypothetical protein